MATAAATDPDGFRAGLARLSGTFSENVDRALQEFMHDSPKIMLARWRAERAASEAALAAVPPGQLVPWLVRPLPAAVLAAAGMMELFGHGQDIADTVGVPRVWTDRLWHVVAFAVRVWDFGYLARGLTPPDAAFRFEIVSPSGDLWRFGPAESKQTVSGPAADFCLLVTRRRHRDDLALTASGTLADDWLTLAQAYRGPAGPGRQPGQFSKDQS